MRVITLTRIAVGRFSLTVDTDGICVLDRTDGPAAIAAEIAQLRIGRHDRLFGGAFRVKKGDFAWMLGVPLAALR